MAIRSQLVKRFGFAEETTWGTAVTVDNFLPIVDFDVSGGPEKDYSEAIVSGTLTHEDGFVGMNSESYEFSVGGELYDHGLVPLLVLMMGAIATDVDTPGAGLNTHTITQAEPLPSFTSQIAVPDESGSVRAMTFAGCVFNSFEINVEAGKRATWGGTATAQSETIATSPATLSYPTDLVPLHSKVAALTLWGSAYNAKSFKLTGEFNNTYDERRFLGSSTIGARQVAQDLRAYKAEIVVELNDNFVQYARYKADTTGAIDLTMTVGDNVTSIDLPTARIIEGMPSFTGRGIVEQTLTVEGLGAGATQPLTITSISPDAAP